MATIETGADGKQIKPYVTTYSKRQVRDLLNGFDILDISVRQLSAKHFCLPGFLGPVFEPLRHLLQPLMGWYVVSTATKR
jgi:hypothetical protein